tara:strand:- start:29 stop:244 length:216 start_codon:yes stop_codon:yes gene_type:complete
MSIQYRIAKTDIELEKMDLNDLADYLALPIKPVDNSTPLEFYSRLAKKWIKVADNSAPLSPNLQYRKAPAL